MNKLIKRTPDGCIVRTADFDVWDEFIHNMVKNNVFCPGIERVIFNLKTTETRPVLDAAGKPVTDEKGRVKRQVVDVTPELATVVYFTDGTKCTVVNSDKDVVTTEEKEVTYFDFKPDGTETTVKTGRKVKVASEAAKEAGIVYAIVKRIFGKVGRVDKQGKLHEDEIDGNGFGRKLRDIVNSAEDAQYDVAFNDEMKKLAVKEHKDREAAAKERKAARTPSIEENIATLVRQNAELLAKLNPGA